MRREADDYWMFRRAAHGAVEFAQDDFPHSPEAGLCHYSTILVVDEVARASGDILRQKVDERRRKRNRSVTPLRLRRFDGGLIMDKFHGAAHTERGAA